MDIEIKSEDKVEEVFDGMTSRVQMADSTTE